MPFHWLSLTPRLRAVALACAATALACAALDKSLPIVWGDPPAWIPPIFGTERLVDFETRIAKFEELEQTGIVTNDHLVAVIGLSQIRRGLDPEVLAAHDPLHRDWLVLGGEGRTFRQLALFARVLIDSSLRPGLVVLGFSKSQVVRDEAPPEDPVSLRLLPRHLRQHLYWQAAKDCSWLVENRLGLFEGSLLLNYRAARLTRALFGLPFRATYVPEADPFSPAPTMAAPGNVAVDDADWQRRRILFTSEGFEGDQPQIDAFCDMVRQFRAKGGAVIFLLVPESARFRAAFPPIAARQLDRAMTAAAGNQPVGVIDCAASMPDRFFHDDTHLSAEGRSVFSALLPSKLP